VSRSTPIDDLSVTLDRFLAYGATTTSLINASPIRRRDRPPVDDDWFSSRAQLALPRELARQRSEASFANRLRRPRCRSRAHRAPVVAPVARVRRGRCSYPG
jgi:hypothetical protein